MLIFLEILIRLPERQWLFPCLVQKSNLNWKCNHWVHHIHCFVLINICKTKWLIMHMPDRITSLIKTIGKLTWKCITSLHWFIVDFLTESDLVDTNTWVFLLGDKCKFNQALALWQISYYRYFDWVFLLER